jgi:hypothetical protein
MEIFESDKHLVEKRLNVFSCQILRRHDQFVQIRIDIYEKENSTVRNRLETPGGQSRRSTLTFKNKI